MSDKPAWWPKNPYPEDIFEATTKDYCAMVPDRGIRTAISGALGRFFWDIASESIWDALQAANADGAIVLSKQESKERTG